MAALPTNHHLSFPPPPTARTVNVSRKRRLRARSILKKTSVAPRQAFMTGLLLMSLVMLTLSVIYASCVALPHSDYSNHSRRDTWRAIQGRDDPTGDTPDAWDSNSQGLSNTTQNDQQQHDRFTQSGAMASLGFYALTLPFLTMLHAGVELLILCIRPETLNPTASSQYRYKRVLPILSLCTSVALLLGWIPMNLIWMNCEIAGFSPMAEDKICPVQILGHRMGGVDELSIAKVVFAWMTVLTYTCYIFYTQFIAKKDRRSRGEGQQRARFAPVKSDMDDEPEDIVIGLEHNGIKDTHY